MLDLEMLRRQALNLQNAIDACDDHFMQMVWSQHLGAVKDSIRFIEKLSGARPSRRERRRARKAAKNAAMVRLVGWRPWAPGLFGHTRLADRTMYGTKEVQGDAMDQVSWWWGQKWDNGEREYYGERQAHRLPDFMNTKLKHLREPSGFVAMSRTAEKLGRGGQ